MPKWKKLNFDGLERGWKEEDHNDQKDNKGILY